MLPIRSEPPDRGSRTVILTNNPAMQRGRLVTPALPVWPAKEPSEFLIYEADFRPLAPCGTRITNIKAAVVDGALTIGALTYRDTVAVVELGGGTDQVTATVLIKVLLSSGEVAVRSILLPVIAQPGSSLLPDFGIPSGGSDFRLTDPKTGLTLTDPATGLPLTLSPQGGTNLTIVDPRSGALLVDPRTGLQVSFPTVPNASLAMIDSRTGQTLFHPDTHQPMAVPLS